MSVDTSYVREDLSIDTSFLEGILGGIMAGYLPDLTSDIGGIPMPELEGFSMEISSTDMGGADVPAGYWMLLGGLE